MQNAVLERFYISTTAAGRSPSRGLPGRSFPRGMVGDLKCAHIQRPVELLHPDLVQALALSHARRYQQHVGLPPCSLWLTGITPRYGLEINVCMALAQSLSNRSWAARITQEALTPALANTRTSWPALEAQLQHALAPVIQAHPFASYLQLSLERYHLQLMVLEAYLTFNALSGTDQGQRLRRTALLAAAGSALLISASKHALPIANRWPLKLQRCLPYLNSQTGWTHAERIQRLYADGEALLESAMEQLELQPAPALQALLITWLGARSKRVHGIE